MDELSEKMSIWEPLLERAEGLVAGDPFSALGWARKVASEVASWRRDHDDWRRDHPHERESLEMLAQRAQRLIAISAQASQRMLEEAAERQRQFHERELGDAITPTPELRRPWPPPDGRS